MAFNIMDMITDQLTPDNIKAVAGMLGENESMVTSALSGAAPAIMGGLLGTLSKPEGKRVFEQQLNDADDGLAGNLAGLLGSGGGAGLAANGGKMLGAMFGNNSLTGLISAISGSSGMSKTASTSLLGLAAPMVMGMLKGKSKSDGLDFGGMVNMLMGQKDNITKSLPSGLGDALSGTGMLDGVLGKASDGVSAVADAGQQAARSTAAAAEDVAKTGGSLLGKLVPIILIVLACWLAYNYFVKPADPVSSSSVSQAITSDLSGALNQAMTSLAGIDSVDSARAALGKLQGLDRGLSKIITGAVGLSPAQSTQLSQAITKILPDLENAARKARSVPGVDDIIGPSLDSVLGKLKSLAK